MWFFNLHLDHLIFTGIEEFCILYMMLQTPPKAILVKCTLIGSQALLYGLTAEFDKNEWIVSRNWEF